MSEKPLDVRIANILRWDVRYVKSFSYQSLRELVKEVPIHTAAEAAVRDGLVAEMTAAIQSGSYIRRSI